MGAGGRGNGEDEDDGDDGDGDDDDEDEDEDEVIEGRRKRRSANGSIWRPNGLRTHAIRFV